MWMRKLYLVILCCGFLAGCGKKVPQIALSPDGGSYNLQTTTFVQVLMADGDYDDVSITFDGAEDLALIGITCTPASNSPAQCYSNRGGFGNFGGQLPTGGGIGMQSTYKVLVIADRKGEREFRLIKFSNGFGQAGTPSSPPGTPSRPPGTPPRPPGR